MKKKKLLIFAHYYYPDVASTGQLLQDQAEAFSSFCKVTVICTIPSYTGVIDEKYKEHKIYTEEINGVRVVRVPVPEFSKTNKVSRIKNILAYYLMARRACRAIGKQDYIYSISQPPILGGMLGAYGKKVHNAKFIYCIQDFNPEQIMAVGYIHNKLILKAAMWLDKRSCRKADLVVTVGRDLMDTLRNRFKGEKPVNSVMINNWVNEDETYPLKLDNEGVAAFRGKYDLTGKFVIMYSGNLGLYYDLKNILKVINRFPQNTHTGDGREVVFAFVGAGSLLDEMKQYALDNKMDNVRFIPYQDKKDLIYSLNAADVHWCVNSKGIKGVSCPSKFYGIAAVGKPVIGVLENGSEIEQIITESGCGLCCEPGDYDSIEKNIRWFIEHADSDAVEKMGESGYEYLIKNLKKDISISKYRDEIFKL